MSSGEGHKSSSCEDRCPASGPVGVIQPAECRALVEPELSAPLWAGAISGSGSALSHLLDPDGFLFDPNRLLLNPPYSASATFAVTPRNSSLRYGPRILARREACKEADPTDPGSNPSLSNNPELALTWLPWALPVSLPCPQSAPGGW